MSRHATLILAAGKGTRMKSAVPKVLHSVAGVPMIERVCDSAVRSKSESIGVVIGHGAEQVKAHLSKKYPKLVFFEQRRLDGSGGAVRQAARWLSRLSGNVIVTCGDTPLFQAATFKSLTSTHRREKNLATVLTMVVPQPKGYGRIVRAKGGAVLGIVEELDASDRQKSIAEVNSGTYCFSAKALARSVQRLKNNNAKKEYYLTDVLQIIRNAGGRVGGVVCSDYKEAMGINSRVQLAEANRIAFRRKAEAAMLAGVTIIDPATTWIEEGVSIGTDTVIWPNTFLLGATRIGRGCTVGPSSHLRDAVIGENVTILASFVESARIRDGAQIGPMARVRPKSDVGVGARLGNFSEIKAATLGPGAKVNHLSYMGDAKVGKNVNIGAGTITCNYDGFRKHPTIIREHAFIGSNVNLIAPVQVGAHSVVGAGSSISSDVPPWSLAVERARAIVKRGWAKRRKK